MNCMGVIAHSRLIRQGRIIPGLDKNIEDASTNTLALHRNLFSYLNLDGTRTLCINHVEDAAPHFGLSTAASNGATDFATAMDKHLCPHLAWYRTLSPDNCCHGDGLSAFQFIE